MVGDSRGFVVGRRGRGRCWENTEDKGTVVGGKMNPGSKEGGIGCYMGALQMIVVDMVGYKGCGIEVVVVVG